MPGQDISKLSGAVVVKQKHELERRDMSNFTAVFGVFRHFEIFDGRKKIEYFSNEKSSSSFHVFRGTF